LHQRPLILRLAFGAASSFTIPPNATAGTLELAVNDFVEWYSDNSGGYAVSLG
jgi:hypothetical protein